MTKKLYNKSPKSLRNYIIIITCIFFVILIAYSDIIKIIHSNHHEISNDYKSKQFDSIMMYYDDLYEDAYNQAIKVSNSIEKDIKENIDLDDLRYQMDNGIIPDELYSIFESNIKGKSLNNVKNSRNGLFVLNDKKVLIDYNYKRVNNNGFRERIFESERTVQWNKPLYDNAIKNIFNQTGNIIAIETFASDNEDHIKIKSPEKDELEKVYKAEGLKGLECYQFLVPAYITDDGDIFGQKDFDKGLIQENHKFIVIQELNLCDQIKQEHPEIMDIEEDVNYYVDHPGSLNILYLLGCMIIASYLIVIVILVNAYNNALEESENSEDKD